MELLSAAQMRDLERADIVAGRVSGPALMERAGAGAVAAICDAYPELAGGEGNRAVVLCGPGNNGGDGFVMARLLHAAGWRVEVFYAGADTRPTEARLAHGKWSAVGDVSLLNDEVAGQGDRPDIIVDAMLGIGVTRPIPLDWALALRAVERRPGRAPALMVAVDCPSGFDCDTGAFILPKTPDAEDGAYGAYMREEVQPRLLRCDLCITFHRPKIGHYLAEVTRGGRRPVVVDIGLPDGAINNDPRLLLAAPEPDRTRLVAPPPDTPPRRLERWLEGAAFPFLRSQAHKYDRGHALVLGGGCGKGGAGRLAARAALRSGAGLVTLAVPPGALQENAARLDAVMLRPLRDAGALAEMLTDDQLSSICLGPGLGVNERTRALVGTALAADEGSGDRRRIVLDADALTSFADEPQALFDLLHDRCVLTPHEGEFARLFPDLSARAMHGSGRSRLDAAREAAARAGAVVLLKGPATIIASPDGATSIHAALYDSRTPWLGTAGAGDVLAGMIAGLLANPLSGGMVHRATEAAAFLHCEAAREFGPGLIAEDLPETLPKVLNRLLG